MNQALASSTEEAASKMAEKIRNVDEGVDNMEVRLSKEIETFVLFCFHQKTLGLNKHFQQIIGIQNQQVKISSFPTCQ